MSVKPTVRKASKIITEWQYCRSDKAFRIIMPD